MKSLSHFGRNVGRAASVWLLCGLAIAALRVPADAHHSATAFYDSTNFPHTIRGVPRYLDPMLVSGAAEYLRQLVVEGPDVAFRQQMTVGHLIGTMLGYHRRPPRPAGEQG